MASTRMSRWGADLYTGRKSYPIVQRRRWWYTLSGVIIVVSALLLIFKGITPSIDFRGGSEFIISGVSSTEQQPAIDAVHSVKPDEQVRVSVVGVASSSPSLRVQTSKLSSDQTTQAADALSKAYDGANVSSQFIGPSWGADVTNKAVRGLLVFLVLVSLVMTIYFRNWRMAVAALVALVHDMIITVGMYAGVGWEVSPATVIGFLTILGYSIYDTVVVFDKVRENNARLLDQKRYTHAELSNLALNQTLVRSINTSVVALLPVSGILFIGAFLLGAGTLRDIALALFIGIIAGTFSSIFIATPVEVSLRNREPAVAKHTRTVLDARAAAVEAGDLGEDGTVEVRVGAAVPGQHLGIAAQPKRRKGGRGAGRAS
ncbi:protein translocase subunit SecF [Isoptericola sp. b441]|uniref:Protein-export membrane protein SecF n=1 Tax=Actinotalea lenta TaxID=3064654 RepID=A0ABT9DE80_9CELL|nr:MULTISPECIES: protein translocase subunit SecF [unclassified Isoptericola]MDO8107816.1 protein translocase subunit SecF [Isoptericola sp. b441]MDO8120513.1 protein translocase subunit SecF [Isoptericola sp. b490]